jgi:ABC-type multidrug transport system fused ATPase/permease subunit
MIKPFFKLLTRCYRLALPYGRLKLFAVLGLILFNGLLQLVGVTSIFPFFALAADPDRIRHSNFGSRFLSILPPLDNNNLLVVSGCCSIGILFFAGIGSIFSEIIRVRYAFSFSHWLRVKVLRSYSSRPYEYFQKKNSAELSQRIFDIQAYTQFVMLPIGEALTRGILILLLVGGIFFVQPLIAIGILFLFGGFYLMVFVLIRPRMRAISGGLQLHNIGIAKRVYQFLHGIKPVLVHVKTGYFIDKAAEHSIHVGSLNSRLPFYSSSPRYLIEPIAFGGLVGVVVVIVVVVIAVCLFVVVFLLLLLLFVCLFLFLLLLL